MISLKYSILFALGSKYEFELPLTIKAIYICKIIPSI